MSLTDLSQETDRQTHLQEQVSPCLSPQSLLEMRRGEGEAEKVLFWRQMAPHSLPSGPTVSRLTPEGVSQLGWHGRQHTRLGIRLRWDHHKRYPGEAYPLRASVSSLHNKGDEKMFTILKIKGSLRLFPLFVSYHN